MIELLPQFHDVIRRARGSVDAFNVEPEHVDRLDALHDNDGNGRPFTLE
jgi:hypothetical protein